jgi:hypothetical protein
MEFRYFPCGVKVASFLDTLTLLWVTLVRKDCAFRLPGTALGRRLSSMREHFKQWPYTIIQREGMKGLVTSGFAHAFIDRGFFDLTMWIISAPMETSVRLRYGERALDGPFTVKQKQVVVRYFQFDCLATMCCDLKLILTEENRSRLYGYQINDLMCRAIDRDQVDVVKWALSQKPSYSFSCDLALQMAERPAFAHLIQGWAHDPHHRDVVVIWSAFHDDVSLFDRAVASYEPTSGWIDHILKCAAGQAARRGHIAIVKRMLSYASTNSSMLKRVYMMATRGGQLALVKAVGGDAYPKPEPIYAMEAMLHQQLDLVTFWGLGEPIDWRVWRVCFDEPIGAWSVAFFDTYAPEELKTRRLPFTHAALHGNIALMDHLSTIQTLIPGLWCDEIIRVAVLRGSVDVLRWMLDRGLYAELDLYDLIHKAQARHDGPVLECLYDFDAILPRHLRQKRGRKPPRVVFPWTKPKSNKKGRRNTHKS